MATPLNILVVGPHPDDQELGMGATIARLADQGHHVLLLDMTNGEPTPHGDPETRAKEAAAAAEILGVRRRLLGLPNRFVEHTIEARHAVAGVIREHQAQIVFLPYFEDAHPDHRATTRIVEDARFDAKLTKIDLPGEPIYPRWMFYYYCTHLRWVADPSFCIDTTGYEQKKRDSIVAYHTQFVLPEKNRRVVEWVDAAGTYFGSRIGTASAEPFFTKEPIGLDGLEGLVI
jgi:bacillithiol biosynthesis deacetylase BshB1